LATPWHFWGDQWLLSIDQIRDTQYFRLEGRYVPSGDGERVHDVQIVGSWWRYLVAAQITYGFLPRFVLWLLSGAMFRRSLRTIRLDGLAFGAIRRRLIDAMLPPVQKQERPGQKLNSANESRVEGPCRAIIWRDLPSSQDEIRKFLRDRFGLSPDALYAVGGTAEDHTGDKAMAAAGRDATPWVVLVEDWE